MTNNILTFSVRSCKHRDKIIVPWRKAQVIDFETKKRFREMGERELANFAWFCEFERSFHQKTFGTDPSFKEWDRSLWMEVKRRAMCGCRQMQDVWEKHCG